MLSHFVYIMEELEESFSRPSQIKPFIDNFNWENINGTIPMEQDYKQFEIDNDTFSLNILTIDDKKGIDYL